MSLLEELVGVIKIGLPLQPPNGTLALKVEKFMLPPWQNIDDNRSKKIDRPTTDFITLQTNYNSNTKYAFKLLTY
jgi:hypothetical protein